MSYLDATAIRSAIASARPEFIVHELTDLRGMDLPRFDRSFANSNLLRTRGTDQLLAAAREFGVRRIVAQSFFGWPYARIGGQVKSEDDPLDLNPAREFRRALDAIRYLENAVTRCREPVRGRACLWADTNLQYLRRTLAPPADPPTPPAESHREYRSA